MLEMSDDRFHDPAEHAATLAALPRIPFSESGDRPSVSSFSGKAAARRGFRTCSWDLSYGGDYVYGDLCLNAEGMVLSNGDLSYARQRNMPCVPAGTDAISPDDLEKASKRKIVRINTQIKKLMSIVCSICGGTGVKCTAVIDPNTRQFLEFTRNALSDGRCSQCGNVALTDPDEVKAGLDKLGRNIRRGIVPPPTTPAATLSGMVITTGVKGVYPHRRPVRRGREVSGRGRVPRLEELKSLALPDPTREFTLMGIQGFEFHDVLENKTYEIGVDDLKIPVTTKEVLDFYPAEHRLKETDIEQYAAAYTARIKAYREYTRQLDATLVRRLLDEERLMKVGESDGFRLKLHFDWFVILKRENERMYAPFKYAVNAYCLDNIQTFDRRYVTLEDALLHCLNGFNENANIPNRYKSIGHYLSGKS